MTAILPNTRQVIPKCWLSLLPPASSPTSKRPESLSLCLLVFSARGCFAHLVTSGELINSTLWKHTSSKS